METSKFLVFNINEFELGSNEKNKLHKLLLDHSNSKKLRLMRLSANYHPLGSADLAILYCSICSKPMTAYLIKMCINCGENICETHAIITDSTNSFLSTFCSNCNPNINDENKENKEDQTQIKLNYSLSSSHPSDSIPTSMICLLTHFLEHNKMKNAMVLIKKFMEKCPLWTETVYQYVDGSSCSNSRVQRLNMFQYLLYKQYDNFSIILPVIKLIKIIQIDGKQKQNIIESLFPLILNFACCIKHIEHEMLSIEWIKECNIIYNNDNSLFTRNIGCIYDGNEELILSPLEYIEYHGRMGNYPQKIVDFIKNTLKMEIVELKEDEKQNDELNLADTIFKNYFFNNFWCGSKTEEYYNSFLSNDINEFELLLQIDDEYLSQDLNVGNRIHRKKILENIERLRVNYKSFYSFFNNLHIINNYNKLKSNGIVVFDVFYDQFSDLNSFINFMEITEMEAIKIWNNLPNQQNNQQNNE